MPFTPAFSDSLPGSMVLIKPEHGWGWRHISPEASSEIEDLPQKGILLSVKSLVANEIGTVGFYGDVKDPKLTYGKLVVLCLLHTCDIIELGACPPVSIHCSTGKVPVVKDASGPCGLIPVWDGMTVVLGWGQLRIDVSQHD